MEPTIVSQEDYKGLMFQLIRKDLAACPRLTITKDRITLKYGDSHVDDIEAYIDISKKISDEISPVVHTLRCQLVKTDNAVKALLYKDSRKLAKVFEYDVNAKELNDLTLQSAAKVTARDTLR